jgi:hypothetical protein
MPNWRSGLKNVIWSAVFAVLAGIAAILSGIFGDSQPLTLGIASFGLILAILAEK